MINTSTEKDIRDYLHLYLGCEVMRVDAGETIELTADVLCNITSPTNHYEYKPVLRPLSSMTEEEALELEDYMWGSWPDAMTGNKVEIMKMFDGPSEYRPGFPIYVRATNWLRKNSFDVDGLLEAGLAISNP